MCSVFLYCFIYMTKRQQADLERCIHVSVNITVFTMPCYGTFFRFHRILFIDWY